MAFWVLLTNKFYMEKDVYRFLLFICFVFPVLILHFTFLCLYMVTNMGIQLVYI